MKSLLWFLSCLDRVWLYARAMKRGFRSGAKVIAGSSIHGGTTSFVSINGIDWPEFATTAHSFWRAQELTLFRQHAHLFSEPAADLGCGDGAFAVMAGFPAKTIGLDYDHASLREAASLGYYSELICADASKLPMTDNQCALFVSNSVLEHLPDLPRAIGEVYRCLAPGGRFICTLTLGEFSGQLRDLTGKRDAEHWSTTFGHIQQPTTTEFLKILTAKGFRIEKTLAYQPQEITAIYRFLISPLIQFWERKLRLSRSHRLRCWLVRHLKDTLFLTNPGKGACLFFVATKPI